MKQPITVFLLNKTHHPLNQTDFDCTAKKLLRKSQLKDILVLMTVIVCGQKYIRSLNRQYRHLDNATDVLSFPLVPLEKGYLTDKNSLPHHITKPINLGDIVICYDFAAKYAKTHHTSINHEIEGLFIHGLLHLLGHHHK